MKKLLIKTDWGIVVVVLLIAAGLVIAASGHTHGIAAIVSSKGEIVLGTRNGWMKNPEKGRTIYHGDKILTFQDSSVQLQFDDGSVLEISANSNVRITQPSQKGVVVDEELGKREIRVFLGKVGYKSSENKNVSTRMISPTAVAALRGTEVQFGTDGNYSFLNRIEGSSDNTGNITEGHVPDIKPEQAAKDPMYQAVLEASKAWGKYLAAKNANASNASVLLAEAVQQTNQALVLENKSLENHPDKLVKTRASEGLKSSQEALKKPLEALKSAIEYQKKVEKNQEQARKDSQNQQAYQLIVKAATEAQEAVVNAVKAYMEIAETHTAEMHGRDFDRKIEAGIGRNIEIAVDMTKNFEKKVQALAEKAISSKDPNVSSSALKSAEVFVAAAALKSAEVFVGAAKVNAAVTEVAARTFDAEISGDKTESQKLNQILDRIMETAGMISDKAMQTETIVARVEKASERNDISSVNEAMAEINAIQKEVSEELKTIPVLPPQSQTGASGTGTTQPAAADQTGTTQDATDTSDTAPPSSDTETTLMQQPPPLQDVGKQTVPYGQ